MQLLQCHMIHPHGHQSSSNLEPLVKWVDQPIPQVTGLCGSLVNTQAVLWDHTLVPARLQHSRFLMLRSGLSDLWINQGDEKYFYPNSNSGLKLLQVLGRANVDLVCGTLKGLPNKSSHTQVCRDLEANKSSFCWWSLRCDKPASTRRNGIKRRGEMETWDHGSPLRKSSVPMKLCPSRCSSTSAGLGVGG